MSETQVDNTDAPARVTQAPAQVGGGTPVEVMPLEAAELAAGARQRRRRLVLYFAAPAIVIGLVITATQVKLGGRSGARSPVVRDWESGMALIETGRISKGLETLENVVARLPKGAERTRAYVRLAEVYRMLGEEEPHYLNSAIRHYATVLDSAGDAASLDGAVPVDELLYETGRCFVALGSYETALEFFEQIDVEFPASLFRPQARLEIGESYLAIGQYQRARRVLAEVAETYRGDPLGEKAFFRFADSFDEQAGSLRGE